MSLGGRLFSEQYWKTTKPFCAGESEASFDDRLEHDRLAEAKLGHFLARVEKPELIVVFHRPGLHDQGARFERVWIQWFQARASNRCPTHRGNGSCGTLRLAPPILEINLVSSGARACAAGTL